MLDAKVTVDGLQVAGSYAQWLDNRNGPDLSTGGDGIAGFVCHHDRRGTYCTVWRPLEGGAAIIGETRPLEGATMAEARQAADDGIDFLLRTFQRAIP
jgi:hypothetical protein